jgi:probable F420-dependent oxidoreductase
VTGLNLAVQLPQTFDDGRSPADVTARFARAAERLGFDGLWTLDRTQGLQAVIEPLSLLAAAAMVTRRVRLGVAVIIVPFRSPVTLARTAAAVDQLSGGRLDLGVGLGSRRREVLAVGLDPALRRQRLEDAVAVLRGLWSGEPLDYVGETLEMHGWVIRPRPVQRPGPPLWFGGSHPAALRRAVALGDGWLGAGSHSLDDFDREVVLVREELARQGRPSATYGLGKRLYMALEDRRGERARTIRRWLGDNYRDPTIADRVATIGPPEAIVEAAVRIIEQGGRTVIFHTVSDEDRQLRELAEAVLPAIRASVGQAPPA